MVVSVIQPKYFQGSHLKLGFPLGTYSWKLSDFIQFCKTVELRASEGVKSKYLQIHQFWPKNWSKGGFLIRKISGIKVSNKILKILIFGKCQPLDLPLFWPRCINFQNSKLDCIQFLPSNLNFDPKHFFTIG